MILVLTACCLAALTLYFLLRPGLREAPEAPGGRQFTLSESKAYFVDNSHAGRLYVIEGVLTNNMSSPMCRIAIKAALLDAGGRELSQQIFEAGTAATISELKLLDWNELRARLLPPGPDTCQGTTILPGASGRFMAVFRDPPDQAATFDLIVSGSQLAGPNRK
jgi:hypothetical protein